MVYLNSEVHNKKKFEDLYNRYFHFFYQVAMQFLNRDDEAKGVVQESFIKMWEKEIYTQTEQSVKNYLFILVRNGCLNILRQRKRRMQEIDESELLQTSVSLHLLEETSEEILLYKELSDRIASMINKLTPQCREVFKLSRFNNYTNKDIAEELGISVKAVEANMTRALKQLRQDLKLYLDQEDASKFSPGMRSALLSLF
ncbi:RNA polymerase sigma-70 factor [Mangrovibacterium diazotrophicum]|uniref:RNA polymerase sigma-70 factor (ECF subfamily) n=1 Tax=Mangrovibacterium diazotrophicum TaxID=1261403 RepID=A0A419VYK1_9BACT|nr:RNA polymerase sigma-70 factor [Mangrovibacterium diazotrophicum]RKD88296.1 RNA polymerase sigma-70 factor (ECF subfamily) [Mangrovibacterium diazotrophicum]